MPNTTRISTRRQQDERYKRRVGHALRAVARVRCMQQVNAKRNDADEISEIDVQVPSHPAFAKWAKGLTDADKKSYSVSTCLEQ